MRYLCSSITLATLALVLLASGTRAQEIRPVVDGLVRSWARADAGAFAAIAANAGVDVVMQDERSGPLNARQLNAVLREVFDESETDSVRTVEARVVAGTPPRAFGQFAWTMRKRGTTIPQRSTVFLAFIREDETWKITEIRLMR